jgi:hypothetical protein
MRFYLAVFIAVMFSIETHAGTGDKSPPSGIESLGGRLLDDLSPDAALNAPPRSRKIKTSRIRSKPPAAPRIWRRSSPTSQSLLACEQHATGNQC